MNIEDVQRRLWEQSQAHKQHRESGTPLFPTNPYGGRIRGTANYPVMFRGAADRCWVYDKSRSLNGDA